MLMVNTILKVLLAEMYINVVFVQLFVQRSEFNSCSGMTLYKNYLLLFFIIHNVRVNRNVKVFRKLVLLEH